MSKFRIAIIRIMHESNSFSCIEAQLEHFKNIGGILIGNKILVLKCTVMNVPSLLLEGYGVTSKSVWLTGSNHYPSLWG